MNMNECMVKNIHERKSNRSEFGYGITTADKYVQQALDDCGRHVTCNAFGSVSAEQLIKEASNRLVYSNPDMVIEQKHTNPAGLIALPDGVDIPEHTLMTIQHIVTTSKEDRDKDILETEGAMLDPRAPLLWQHMHTLPIGKVIATITHTPELLRVASVLLDLNELTGDVAKLIEADALRFSHGFRALEFEERKKEDGSFPGFRITKFEVMEISVVSVPSNTSSVIELYNSNKLESDFFKAHAKHYLDARPVQVTGADIHETQMTLKLGDAEMTVKAQNVGDAMVAMKSFTDEEGSVPEFDEMEPESDKGGRVLSARNLTILKDVHGDLEDMNQMDLSRGAHALCERCITKLGGVIKAAHPMDDDEKPKPKPDDEKPKAIETITVTRETTAEEAAQILLACDDVELKNRVYAAIGSFYYVAELDQIASEYREQVT